MLATAFPLMTRANLQLLSSGTFYLAETEIKQAVGCGGWTLQRPGPGEVVAKLAHIRHFATHPDWIGTGIARAIYAKCEYNARQSGVVDFECYSSLNAEGFYQSLGFENVKPISVRMGADVSFSSILMKRSI